MKRHDPKRRGLTEQRLDSNRHYGSYIKQEQKQSRVNPIFTEPPHYQEVKK